MNEFDNAKNDMKNFGNEVKGKAMQAADSFKEKAIELGHKTLDKATDFNQYALETIRQHPYKSLMLAFIAGYLCSKRRT